MDKRWWPTFGAIGGAAIGLAIGWAIAGDDMNKLGDWRNGAARFVGLIGALGAGAGYIITRQLAGVVAVTRDGFTLAYKRIDPQADGYREMTTVTVGKLVTALREVGYEPAVQACDEAGTPAGSIDDATPLAGANLAIRDRGVRGWVRVQLPPPIEGQARSLGLVEMWSERGDSTEELGLFTLRALDGLLPGLTAARESSRLSDDPASLLTAGLDARPVHRKS